jgi:phosphatidylglycerophosphatase A
LTVKDQKLPALNQIDVFFLSCGGLGFARYAPGTIGSLSVLPVLMFLGKYEVPIFFIFPILMLAIFGSCLAADVCQKRLGLHDPQWIVIDEVLGMTVTWLFFPNADIYFIALQFGLFRFFDIVKIWPVSFFDKKIKHGAGTILDDIVSGLYAGGVSVFLIYLFKNFFST